MPIKPGMTVDIYFDRPSMQEAPLDALVYHVEGKRIILSQTSPPIFPPHVGQPVKISFVSSGESHVRRVGFAAVVSGLVEDFPLVSGELVPAVALDREQKVEEINLRRNFRVRPAKDSGLELTIYRNRYDIIDLSLMGLSFSQSLRQDPWKATDKIELRLRLDGRIHPLKARVVRVSTLPHARAVAVAFLELGKETEAILWKTIFAIDRENLSRRRHV
jgi:hypothetical protein